MKVRIERTFPVAASPEAAWQVLQDIEAVAACMPGARITERVDDTHYKGTVSVKVGPATLAFRGTIEVLEVQPATRLLRLAAKGTDNTGTSGASMTLAANIETDGTISRLVGRSETTLSGKAATFGGRMADAVADQVLARFGAQFAARVVEQADATPSTPPAGTAAATSAEPAPISGLGLAWAAFKAWLRGFFTRKAA